ncbi:MAG TPA: LuxR C-terminal-related transcriptional regulator, partial [Rubrobacter sp.]|nr:LuxR C-terminal-related transcriptional regulator [Rubrobacter sp.]
SAVARVCRRLDGMPLAIELAAARTRVLSAGQIADRLEESFRMLRSTVRSSLPRQQTLRATMDWSFGLLYEEEKNLFARLSVFTDGFTLAAAEEVCGADGIDRDEVADILFRLAEKSLLVVDRREEGEQTRFRLLETVREYASERLQENGEARLLGSRHAAYFLRLAERAAPELFGPDQATWLGTLEAEHDNLRSALGWALGEGGEAGLRLANALGEFWYMHGHLEEGRRWLDRGLASTGSHSPLLRARALEKVGWIAIFQNDDEATTLLEESLRLFKELGDEQASALALAGLGWALLYLAGDESRLLTLRAEAEVLRKGSLDRWTLSHLLTFLALAALVEEDHDHAVALSEESMALSRELGDTLGLAICTHTLGMAAAGQGDYERASALFEENLRVLWEQGDRVNVGHCLLGLGGVAISQGHPERATLLWGAAESLREATGSTLTPLVRSHYAYEARLADARSRMGEAAFLEAWDRARALTPRQAVEYALEREDRDPRTYAARALPAGLSEREAEVLALAARGLTSAQIGEKLFISPRTVNRHLDSVYKKVGVNSRAAAARFASEHGIA